MITGSGDITWEVTTALGAIGTGGILRHFLDLGKDLIAVAILEEADIAGDEGGFGNDVVLVSGCDLAGADHAGIEGVVVLGRDHGNLQHNVTGGLDRVHSTVGTGAVTAHALDGDLKAQGACHHGAVGQVDDACGIAARQMGADGLIDAADAPQVGNDLIRARADLLCHLEAEVDSAAELIPDLTEHMAVPSSMAA